MGRFLIWLSGARRQILAECPTERAKYVGIGTAILITAVMAAVSLTFALVTALKADLWVALPFAIAWGVAILSLDRLFVVSLPRKGKRRSHLFRATPRFLLALLLGFVISTPFVLQIFRPEIEHEITILHDQAAAAYYKQLKTSPLQQQINQDAAEVNKLEAVAANGGQGANLDQDPTLQALNKQLSGDQAKATYYYNQLQCQLYGDGGHCTPGPGTQAAKMQAAYKGEEAQVNLVQGQIQSRQQYLLKTNAALQSGNQAEAKKLLPGAQQALRAAENEQALETNTFTSNNENNGGLLIRLQALGAITAGNSTLNAARWLLFALFVVIDCMPVMIKVMLNMGPENNYDRLLEAEEKKQLRVAANNRALRQAAEMMAAETVIGEARSRLAGWNADIPEVTQNVIATRARVEVKKLNAWENGQTRRLFNGHTTVPAETSAAEPPVDFIAWPWVNGSAARGRWQGRPSVLQNLRWRAYQVLGVLRPSRRSRGTPPHGAHSSRQRPYGAPFTPSTPGPLNGFRRGTTRTPP